MAHDGPSFYDEREVFDLYRRKRATAGNANDTLERPLVRELLGDVRGLHVLDLGCGDGGFGLELLEAGAASYAGIDGSANMVEAAQRALAGTRGRARRADLRAWRHEGPAVDVACSRLVLHYLPELAPALGQARDALRPGGRIVVSVEHPVITCREPASRADGGVHEDWVVDDYFDTGERTVEWLGASVAKYHRTVEDWFGAFQQAGFRVDALRESRPQRANFADDATYARRRRIPLFLLIAASR